MLASPPLLWANWLRARHECFQFGLNPAYLPQKMLVSPPQLPPNKVAVREGSAALKFGYCQALNRTSKGSRQQPRLSVCAKECAFSLLVFSLSPHPKLDTQHLPDCHQIWARHFLDCSQMAAVVAGSPTFLEVGWQDCGYFERGQAWTAAILSAHLAGLQPKMAAVVAGFRSNWRHLWWARNQSICIQGGLANILFRQSKQFCEGLINNY